MTALSRFVADRALSMTAKRVSRNPHMANSADMDHWSCLLRRGEPGVDYAEMRVTFSMGKGHNGTPPTVDDVLDCLASDASGYEDSHGFGEWCMDYGFDPDSRKAERSYRIIGQQAQRLRDFLGADDYDTLLFGTERL